MRSLKGYLPEHSFAMVKKKAKDSKAAASVEPPVLSRLESCTRCRLCETRKNVVVGEGSAKPAFLFVGEAPGATEDETGRPFVGRSGQLLTKMIEAMGLKREDVFIANMVKCRPPENRAPRPDEVEQCRPYLEMQIKMLKPKMVVALGATAAKNLLQTKEAIGDLRGRTHDYQGTKLVATFHPAYLLRNPPAKKDCWEDLQLAMKEIGFKK